MTSPDQRPDETPDPAPPGAPKSQSERDRALAALHHLAKPQPKAPEPGGEPVEEGSSHPASGPSGFVGMLSRGQGSGDTHVAAPAVGGGSGEAGSIKSKHGLGVAREIMPNPPAPGGAREQAARAAGPRRGGPPPKTGAYGVLLPLVAFVAMVLLLIGIWALGAVIYINSVKPIDATDIGYPLIRWDDRIGESGDWTPGSRFMAWAMLACLPLALILGATCVAIWRRITRRPAPAKRQG